MGYQIRLLRTQTLLLFLVANGGVAFGRSRYRGYDPLSDLYPENIQPIQPGVSSPIDIGTSQPGDTSPFYPTDLSPSINPSGVDLKPIFIEYIKLTLPPVSRLMRLVSRFRQDPADPTGVYILPNNDESSRILYKLRQNLPPDDLPPDTMAGQARLKRLAYRLRQGPIDTDVPYPSDDITPARILSMLRQGDVPPFSPPETIPDLGRLNRFSSRPRQDDLDPNLPFPPAEPLPQNNRLIDCPDPDDPECKISVEDVNTSYKTLGRYPKRFNRPGRYAFRQSPEDGINPPPINPEDGDVLVSELPEDAQVPARYRNILRGGQKGSSSRYSTRSRPSYSRRW